MIRKLDLIAALEKIQGNPIVTLWDEQYKEDVDIRRVMVAPSSNPADRGTIVLSSELFAPRELNVIATTWEED